MRVAIAQVDGKWPNLALAKLASWHRRNGHRVELYSPLSNDAYSVVYAGKVFADTPDHEYLPADARRGGSGCVTSLAVIGVSQGGDCGA